jgi:hypothetical protein
MLKPCSHPKQFAPIHTARSTPDDLNRPAEEMAMIRISILTLVLSGLVVSSGCSSNRWLSRRYYSEMQDPFMEPATVADATGDDNVRQDSTGRARLKNYSDETSDAVVQDSQLLKGPKPIQRSASEEDAPAVSGRISNATYPRDAGAQDSEAAANSTRSYSGPALSDFLQKKRTASMENSQNTATPDGRRTSTPAFRTADRTESQSSSGNPAQTASIAEDDGFSSFLSQKSAAAAEVARNGAAATNAIADEASDFASWTKQQQANFSDTKDSAENAIATAPARMKEDFKAATQKAQQVANSSIPDFDHLDFSESEDETAEPLMQNLDAKKPALNKISPAQTSGEKLSGAAETNPFEESFTPAAEPSDETAAAAAQEPEFDVSRAGARPKRQLDDSFRIDSGWKPSHLTRP